MNKLIYLFLLTCSCATNYTPEVDGRGYNQQRLTMDTYEVSFKGNKWTSKEQASSHFIKRCADLTIGSGFSYFEVIPQPQQRELSVAEIDAKIKTAAKPERYGVIKMLRSPSESSYDAMKILSGY